jgi:DNA polymerase III delta subunit
MKSTGTALPKQPPSILVLSGDDTIGREKARERIVQQVLEAHPGAVEEHYDPSREPFTAFAERIITPSLFHPMRIFHIRHANELSAKEVSFLADIAAAPPPDATIVVEIDPPQRGAGKTDAILQKLGGKKGKSDSGLLHLAFAKPPEYKLAAWLTEQVPLLFGREISKPNAEHLLDMIGAELDKIYSELVKIDILLPAGAPIDKEAIEYITGSSRVMNVNELAKAVGAKNFVRTLEVVDSLFTASVSLPAAVSALFRHFWAMFRIRAFAESQRETMRQYLDKRAGYERKNAIAAEIGVAAGLLKKDDPPSKAYPVVILSGIVDQARGFTTAQLKQIIRWLQEFDAAVKSGQMEPAKSNFQLLCYKIIRVAELEREKQG